MKGMVFNMLNDMVEERFGMDAWDQLLDETQPESGGIYTSVEVYPDTEIVAYVVAISGMIDKPIPEVLHAFGHYMMGRFAGIHPEFFEGHTAKSFLKSVHDVIHVEVRKLHPDVILPEFTYEEPADDKLVMHYHSPRQMCHLAEGLIDAAGDHFGVEIKREHPVCMHNGADHCRIELSFAEKG